MNSWFDILSIDDGLKSVNYQDVITNCQIVLKNIEEEKKILKDDSKVFVGGFSQGCSLALYTGLMTEYNLGGIIALSGTYFDSIIKLNPLKKKMPILYYIGENDMVVYYDHAKQSLSPLIDAKFNIEFHSEKYLEHSLSMKEVLVVKHFCTRHFK